MTDKTPYIGFSNNTLETLPEVKKGDTVACKKCGKDHALRPAKDRDGNDSILLLSYKCGDTSYVAAIGGRLIMGTKSDVSGSF